MIIPGQEEDWLNIIRRYKVSTATEYLSSVRKLKPPKKPILWNRQHFTIILVEGSLL